MSCHARFSFESLNPAHVPDPWRVLVAILLLESDGLQNWANRLELGPLRTVAQPAASALNKTLQPLGIAGLRDRTLDEATRFGWSEDAVRLARMTPPPTEQAAASQPPAGHASSAAGSPVPQPKSNSILTAAAVAPIVGSIPYRREPYPAGADRTGQVARW